MRHCWILVFISAVLVTAPAFGTVVKVDLAGGGDFLTIQEGINVAGWGDTVLVAPGTYVGPMNHDLDFYGTNIVLVSESGVDSTIVECEHLYDGFHFYDGEDTTSVVVGFTVRHALDAFEIAGSSPLIENCRVDSSRYRAGTLVNSGAIFRNTVFRGGHGNGMPRDMGLVVQGTPAPTFRGCTFEGLTQYLFWCVGSDITLRQCDIIDCLGGDYGVIYCEACSPLFEDVLVQDCYSIDLAPVGGDCMFFSDCSAIVRRVRFLRCGDLNTGTVHIDGGTAALREVVFLEDFSAPVIFARGNASLDITNVTIASCLYGDAIGLDVEASVDVVNSIIAFNGGVPIVNEGTGSATTFHSCVFQNAGGDSLVGSHFENLFEDPLFCELPAGNVTLRDDSPCLPWNNLWDVLMGAYGPGGCWTGVDELDVCETQFRLCPPYPNPTSGPVSIAYSVSRPGTPVKMEVFNLAGELVRAWTEPVPSGGQDIVVWDGDNHDGLPVASGVYWVRGTVGSHSDQRCIVIIR